MPQTKRSSHTNSHASKRASKHAGANIQITWGGRIHNNKNKNKRTKEQKTKEQKTKNKLKKILHTYGRSRAVSGAARMLTRIKAGGEHEAKQAGDQASTKYASAHIQVK